MHICENMKAQISIEFLFSLLIYLMLISTLIFSLLSVDPYLNSKRYDVRASIVENSFNLASLYSSSFKEEEELKIIIIEEKAFFLRQGKLIDINFIEVESGDYV